MTYEVSPTIIFLSLNSFHKRRTNFQKIARGPLCIEKFIPQATTTLNICSIYLKIKISNQKF